MALEMFGQKSSCCDVLLLKMKIRILTDAGVGCIMLMLLGRRGCCCKSCHRSKLDKYAERGKPSAETGVCTEN